MSDQVNRAGVARVQICIPGWQPIATVDLWAFPFSQRVPSCNFQLPETEMPQKVLTCEEFCIITQKDELHMDGTCLRERSWWRPKMELKES